MSAPLEIPDYMLPMYEAWLERGGDTTPPSCRGCGGELSAWAVEQGYDFCSKPCREAATKR